MARRKTPPGPKELANLRPIKKGEVRNPLGISDPLKGRLRKMTAFELQEMVSILLRSELGQLKKIYKNPKESAFRQWLAGIVITGRETGDEKKMNAILDRCVGKVSDKFQFFGPDDDPNKADQLSLEEKMAMIKASKKELDLLDDE